jgi:hypothetical protein
MVLLASVKRLPVPSTKPLSPLIEYCQVAADEGITYRIKGTNVDKFAITDDTGILTYKAIQTSVHNDTVTIVATDVAGTWVSIMSTNNQIIQAIAIDIACVGD